MHLLGFHDIFTTKTTVTRVRAVPRYSFSIDTLERLNTIHSTVGIMPSGLPWVAKPLKGNENLFPSLITSYKSKWSTNGGTRTDKLKENLGSVDKFHKHIYSVPYSDHSCFMEIQEFINLVQPTNIRGIVNSSSCYVDPLYYFGRLCRANQPSLGLNYKQEKRVEGKRLIAVQTKSNVGSGKSSEANRKQGRTAELDISGVQVSKVNALRQVRRGAKIAQNESSD